MARSPQEVFAHHAEVLIAGDLEGIVSDYADDAVFITPGGVLRGKDGVREGFTKLLGDVPNADWAVPRRSSRATRCSSSGARRPRRRGSRTGSTRSSSATARSGSRRCVTRCSTTSVDLTPARSTSS